MVDAQPAPHRLAAPTASGGVDGGGGGGNDPVGDAAISVDRRPVAYSAVAAAAAALATTHRISTVDVIGCRRFSQFRVKRRRQTDDVERERSTRDDDLQTTL